jgi:hypothetical protein
MSGFRLEMNRFRLEFRTARAFEAAVGEGRTNFDIMNW